MRFLEPEMASWLLLVPLGVSFWLLHFRAKRAFRRQASFGPVLRGLSRLSRGRRDAAVLAAIVLALGSLVLAMMQPQLFLTRRLPQWERQDLVLILDRSASMRARDVPPSRFARAIEEIKTFLAEKPEGLDRIGLVGFAGTSLVLSHLTRDLDSLFFYLDWIEEDLEPRFGTDIGAALASAREMIRKDDRQTKKILLLLSDGDDQGPQLASQLNNLRDQSMRVHCIGIGSERETPIPISYENGVTTYLEDEEGGLLLTRVDTSTLRNIAHYTGGRYFRSSSGRELAEAMREVLRHERKLLGWKSSTDYRDVHRSLLTIAGAAAFFLLLRS